MRRGRKKDRRYYQHPLSSDLCLVQHIILMCVCWGWGELNFVGGRENGMVRMSDSELERLFHVK